MRSGFSPVIGGMPACPEDRKQPTFIQPERPERAHHARPLSSRAFDAMIAVQPPAYFPPLAYTALIYHVDHFVLADTFRFRRETFQNRSKLRNAQGGHWITIPLFGRPHGAPLHTIEIETGGRWREKHWRSFKYDYRTTMYFEFYEEEFRPFFEVQWENLADCTCRSVTLQTELLGLQTRMTRASALKGRPASLDGILEATGAQKLVVAEEQARPDVDVATVERFRYDPPTYHQNFEGFEPGMSAMDLVFNYGRDAPRRLAQGIGPTGGS